MRYLFRADAAPHIGIGDLVSLIKLSEYLDGEKYFIIKNYEASLKLVKDYNLNYFVIEKNISIKDEVNFINKVIETKKIDKLILEITERKLNEYEGLKETTKIAINFDGEICNDLDLVINWNSDNLKYPVKSLVGYEYAIIDKKFFNIKKDNPNQILIAMGGADEIDITYKVVKTLLKNNITNLNVIVGAGYKGKVFELIKPKVNVKNMADEYKKAKIAITAGGLSAIEAATTKTPAILIANYFHQIKRCEFLEKQGVAEFLGYRNFDEKELIKNLNGFKINTFEVKTKKVIDEILRVG
jgi:spore coat polysaccharide biosynthesis predicted glycosyltransferase SpsG